MASEIGSRVRVLRQSRGLTPAQVARAADVTRVWLSRLERGYIADPAPTALARVAQALSVPLPELLTGEPAPPPPRPARTPAAANPTIVQDLVTEAVNHGNLAVADTVLAPTYTVHGPFPDITLNRDQVKRVIARMRRAFPDITVTIDDLVGAEDKVVVRWTLTGTHQGTVAGVAPTGLAFTYAGIAIFRLEEGQVVESWMLADATDRALFERLGFVAPPRRSGARPEDS